MLAKSFGCSGGCAIRQHIDNLAPLQVNDNGPVSATLSPAPVVDACHSYSRLGAQTGDLTLQMPQNGIVAEGARGKKCRRERWETPDGERLIAPLPAGIVGGCGPHLHRLVLMLHFQGQMTCERIVALLAGLGLAISKRQVVRLLTAKLEDFRAEDEAVLRAGLAGAPFVTVDDTGARHAGKGCFTTHIGSDRFAAFRTGPGKSRLAFLGRLLGGAARYVINAAALAYMRGADLPRDIIDKLGWGGIVTSCK